MSILGYLLRRALVALTTLVVVSVVCFLLVNAARGDPALIALEQSGETPTPDLLAEYRWQLGLNSPLPVQYVRWIERVVHGDLGRSILQRRPVATILGERVWPTLQLGLATLAVSTLAGVVLGVVVAFSRAPFVDVAIRSAVVVAAAFPSFLVAIGLIMLIGERLRLVPVAGYGSPQHLILPVLALSIVPAASTLRLTRSAVRSVLAEDFVRTARSKGLAEWTIAVRHVLPSAAAPLIASVGVRFGQILAGTVVIETIFAWPGMATAVITAISGRDVPVIAGYVLITGTLVIVANFLTDLVTRLVDPRVAAGAR
ncbi:MAG: ABC transporter permease [Dehalococcoidia bacterium]|nr:MAG: ABC transporter permease [Dehalococcoidia bacterium]